MNLSEETPIRDALQAIWAERNKAPLDTIQRVQEALAAHGHELGPQATSRLLASRAVAQARLGKPDEASESALEAERLAGPAIVQDAELDFEVRRIKGRAALFAAQETEALKLALMNLEIALGHGDADMLGLAHSDVATVYGISGNTSRSLEHLQKSLSHTSETDHSRYGALLNNLGNVYMKLNRVEEALACFTRARAAFTKDANALQIAIARSNEARAFDELGDHDRAINVQGEAIDLFAAGGFGSYASASHHKLAQTHARIGNLTAAEKHHLLSLELAYKPGGGTYKDDAHAAYGAFLLEHGRVEEAVEHYSKAVEVTKGSSANANYAAHLENLIKAQEAAGRTAAALASMKELLAIRDTMDTEDASRGQATTIVELEKSLEREVEVVRATTRALVDANRRLAEQSKELVELASTDHLTGLRNRRHFTQRLKRALHGHRESDNEFSVIFIDVDGFKEINDCHGHEMGDLVLQGLASVLATSVRKEDTAARWGGEEFAILLNGADAQAARAIAHKLRLNVATRDWSHLAPDLNVTISAGVISSSEYQGFKTDDIMRIADQLLYQAKLAGRNRVMYLQDEEAVKN